MRYAMLALLVFLTLGSTLAAEEPAPQKPVFHAHVYAPPHISGAWHNLFDTYQPFWAVPDPHDLDGWREKDGASLWYSLPFAKARRPG